MKTRSSIRTDVNNLYRRKVNSWLTAHVKDKQDPPKEFPLALFLGGPTNDDELVEDKDAFLRFCKSWHEPLIAGHVEYVQKTFKGLGTVEVPFQLIFDRPREVAKWAGNLIEYNSAIERLDVIAKELPNLIDSALNVISSISNLEVNDFERFVEVCKWLLDHKQSNSLIRSIPVRGVDTRWFEINRHLLIDFLRDSLELSPVRKDLIQLGLIPPPRLISLRILDHVLRGKVGGMSYLASSKADLEKLNLKPQCIRMYGDLILSWLNEATHQKKVLLDLKAPYDACTQYVSYGLVVNKLKTLAQEKCEALNLSSKLLTSKKLINLTVTAYLEGKHEGLATGWKREVLGPIDEILELCKNEHPEKNNPQQDAKEES